MRRPPERQQNGPSDKFRMGCRGFFRQCIVLYSGLLVNETIFNCDRNLTEMSSKRPAKVDDVYVMYISVSVCACACTHAFVRAFIYA